MPIPLNKAAYLSSAKSAKSHRWCCKPQPQVLTVTPSDPVAAIQPWIAGLHYDNVGTDIYEGVVVVGLVGTRLEDYELVFYNGKNGKMYGRTLLTGWLIENFYITDSGTGYGTARFGPPDGWSSSGSQIQNGSPDGLALVSRVTNDVVEFISYEGKFTATEGPAKGQESVDIGVMQSGTTAAYEWLDKNTLVEGAAGQRSSDFAWSEYDSVFGFQGYPLSPAPDEYRLPWISRIAYKGSNKGVTVCGPSGVDLSKYELVLYNGSPSQSRVYYVQYLEGSTTVAADGCTSISVDVLQGGLDGVALVRRVDGYVSEFFSYGSGAGAVTPSGSEAGPLAGMTSEHISASNPTGIETVTRTGRYEDWTGQKVALAP